MSRILALSVAPGEVRGVLHEDGRIAELRLERDSGGSLVGAVFWARLLQILPSLPGAFVDLGRTRGFLPGERLPRGAAMVEGAALLVQVIKDGFADKAPEVTAAPEFTGRFAIWSPYRPGGAVSRRIASAERTRLQTLLQSLIQPGEGVVLRSHAAGAGVDEITADIGRLRTQYAALQQAAGAASLPRRLDRPADALARIAAGLGPGIDRVVIDDRASRAWLQRLIDPTQIDLDLEAGFTERYGLEEAFEQASAPYLALPGGGEIVIDGTTAFTAIDVNLAAASNDRAPAAIAIRGANLAAAAAIAQQLRLRNLGGAVVVDFISMASRDDRRAVEAALAEAVASDPMPVALLGWTRLGHFELTRQRRNASIVDLLLLPNGARRAKRSITVALEVLRALAATPFQPGRLEIRVHGSVALELNGGLAVALETAIGRAGRKVTIAVDARRDPETFDIGSI